ncbi:MAG: hypothetical protein LBL79_04230 [Prevotella sp.]|nr:hypothetical protein [Prevotella sp.]
MCYRIIKEQLNTLEWSDKEPLARIGIKQTYHGISLKLSYEFDIGR